MFGIFKRNQEPEPKPQRRQAESGYTSRVLKADYDTASGNELKLNTIHSALVACANLVERSILGSTVTGSPAVNHVIASQIARELMLTGESVRLIHVRDGSVYLLPVSDWTITSAAGATSPDEWNYKLTMPAPGGMQTRNVTSDSVVHVRIHVDPARPWQGRNPLAACPAFSEASRRLERYLEIELRTPVGKIIPVPQAQSDYESADGTVVSPLKELKAGLQSLTGKIATPETMMNSGDGRSGAPAKDWTPQALQPIFPQFTPEILEATRSSVYAACGVPSALWSSGAASTREAFRAFLVSCLKPITNVMVDEFGRKLETTITFDFGALLSGDVATKARATKGLVDAGVELNTALTMAGLNPTGE